MGDQTPVSREDLVHAFQMRRYISALARENDCSDCDMDRVIKVLDERLASWVSYCLHKYWRPQGISWAEHVAENRADLHDLVLTTMIKWIAREVKVNPEIQHDELSIRSCFVFRRAAARNIAQHFYTKISSCGHWSMTLTPSGDVRYRDSDLRVTVNELENTWDTAECLASMQDPAIAVEAMEEHEERAHILNLVLERLRSEYNQRQVTILMMCLRDRMTDDEIAAALGENKRNVVRCLERMRPRAAVIAEKLKNATN